MFNIYDNNTGLKVGESTIEFGNDGNLDFMAANKTYKPDLAKIKDYKIGAIKHRATQLLADTDWQLQRANERALLGIKVLERESVNSILIYRESIRKASNRAEAELKKLSNVEDINKFTWEIKTEDSV